MPFCIPILDFTKSKSFSLFWKIEIAPRPSAIKHLKSERLSVKEQRRYRNHETTVSGELLINSEFYYLIGLCGASI